MTDILCGKFEAIPNIRIAVRADQSIQGFCLYSCCFYFNWNQQSHGTDKDVGFVKKRILMSFFTAAFFEGASAASAPLVKNRRSGAASAPSRLHA